MIYTRKDIIPVNEDYINDGSFARILYESEINYQIIFESIIENDMKMINKIKSGVVTESDLQTLNEFSFKEFINKLIQKFKAFLSKLKGAVLGGIQKLILYINSKENKELIKKIDIFNYESYKWKNLNHHKMEEFEYESIIELDMDNTNSNAIIGGCASEIIHNSKKDEILNRDSCVQKFLGSFCRIYLDKDIDTISKDEYSKIILNSNKIIKYSFDNLDYIVDTVIPILSDTNRYKVFETYVKNNFNSIMKQTERELNNVHGLTGTKNDKYYDYSIQNVNIIISALESAININYVLQLRVLNKNIKIAKYVLTKFFKIMDKIRDDNDQKKIMTPKEAYDKYHITQSTYDKFKNGDMLSTKILLKNSLLFEPTFNQANGMLQLVKQFNREEELFENHDGENLKENESEWTEDYMSDQMVKIIDNFSHERWEHLKKVVRHLRPVKHSN